MSWSLEREDGRIIEWERSDRYATVRLRERGDGRFVVRLDVMEQATDDRTYDRVVVDDCETAEAQAAAWRDGRDIET
jgi:hypothetical protein